MNVKDVINRLENGSVHLILISNLTGELIFSTIWFNQIDRKYYDMDVVKMTVKDYELYLEVK